MYAHAQIKHATYMYNIVCNACKPLAVRKCYILLTFLILITVVVVVLLFVFFLLLIFLSE